MSNTKRANNRSLHTGLFENRMQAAMKTLAGLYNSLYYHHPHQQDGLEKILETIRKAFAQRSSSLQSRDITKMSSEPEHWFLSNQVCGMSLYVDRFCGTVSNLIQKLDYFEKLGVNFLHLMPLFESPEGESDGGYAVSDFRKVDKRFGSLSDLEALKEEMHRRNMYLMLDIVLNHTSHHHEWARKARSGETAYQDYYYFFSDRSIPDAYESNMPEIFPAAAPGNFTWVAECNKWVMTVFHNYQWDLNYSNPLVLAEMLDTIFFYANLGVDILRIDAPAFIWKQTGTSCQNLPQAHTLLQLIKICVGIATPGMALLGEAIVAPAEIMKYFGTGNMEAKECDFAYNATQMALQWDALATGDIRVMLAEQEELLKKPYGTSWITYTRCHDDIGLGYNDSSISKAGYDPSQHRKYLKEYYSGTYNGTPARGALFSVNEKTGDARISGSLASLCGLEYALHINDETAISQAIDKILLMQAQSFFIGGVPMLFYGDESAHINDYSYLNDAGKSYDNRWMHRPVFDWSKEEKIAQAGTPENRVFTGTQKLIAIRSRLPVIADKKNLTWITPHNQHVAGFLRAWGQDRVYCFFNFSGQPQQLTWYAFKENGMKPSRLYDHWSGQYYDVRNDNEYLVLPPYSFFILEPAQ